MTLTFVLKKKRALFWLTESNVSSPHHHSNVCVVCVGGGGGGGNVCVGVYATECLHSWKCSAESLHLAVPGVSAVVPLKSRQALAPTPEIQRILRAEKSPPLSLKGRPDPCKLAEST